MDYYRLTNPGPVAIVFGDTTVAVGGTTVMTGAQKDTMLAGNSWFPATAWAVTEDSPDAYYDNLQFDAGLTSKDVA